MARIDGTDNPDAIQGTTGDDTIYGLNGDDSLAALAGFDRLYGGEGNDSLFGHEDDDLLFGGNGHDLAYGADGHDSIVGGNGDDTLYGGAGNDTLRGDNPNGTGSGQDWLYGGDGDDSIQGAAGDDHISGGNGRDYITDDWGGNDSIAAGEDDDYVQSGAGNDTVHGGGGNDTIYGVLGDDSLHGGGGDDTVQGGMGNDTVRGCDGNDFLSGDDRPGTNSAGGDDLVFGGSGNDTIVGGFGDDTLVGRANNDILFGGAGNDRVFGGDGSDLLSGIEGQDSLEGGTGEDTFIAQSDATIVDFNNSEGSITDGDQPNNDFVDLAGYYNPETLATWNDLHPDQTFATPIEWLRADQDDDGTLNMLDGQNGLPTLDMTINQDGRAIGDDAGSSVAGQNLTWDNTNVICFSDDAMIETSEGEVPAGQLRVGDLVYTLDGGLQPIRWIGQRTLTSAELKRHPNIRPVRITRGAIAEDVPAVDLIVSPQHRMLVRSKIARRMFGTSEVLAAAKQLLPLDGIDVAADLDEVTYVHFMFDSHEIVMANGAESESLHTGPEAIKAVGPAAVEEIYAIFPELRDGTTRDWRFRDVRRGSLRCGTARTACR